MKLILLVIALMLVLAPAAFAGNCSVTPSPAVAGSTVLFHADTLNGDNYLTICESVGGFDVGCPGIFDLGFTDPVDILFPVVTAGTYVFTVAHAKGASFGNNIGHGYLQCQVSLEVLNPVTP